MTHLCLLASTSGRKRLRCKAEAFSHLRNQAQGRVYRQLRCRVKLCTYRRIDDLPTRSQPQATARSQAAAENFRGPRHEHLQIPTHVLYPIQTGPSDNPTRREGEARRPNTEAMRQTTPKAASEEDAAISPAAFVRREQCHAIRVSQGFRPARKSDTAPKQTMCDTSTMTTTIQASRCTSPSERKAASQVDVFRCFSLSCPFLSPSLSRRSLSSNSESWLFDRVSDTAGGPSSSPFAAKLDRPSGFSGRISTLPFPFPFHIDGGSSPKSIIPVAWNDAAAAAAAEAFAAG